MIPQVMGNYASKFENALNIAVHLGDGSLLSNEPGKPAVTDGDLITVDELTKSYDELDRTKKKLMDMANMDPVTGDVPFITDCQHNTVLTSRYKNMADKLKNRPEPEDKIEMFHGGYPGEGSKEDVKWDDHYAPVIGTVTKDGQKYYLTLETIAPAPNAFAKDPPMTRPAIGLYKDHDDFVSSYDKGVRYLDNAEKSQAKRMVTTISALKHQPRERSAVGKMIYSDTEDAEEMLEELSGSYERILNSDDRKIKKDIQNIKNKYSESVLPKNAPKNMHNLVPRELRSRFKDLFALYDTVRKKTEQLEICKYVNGKIIPKYVDSRNCRNRVDARLTSDVEESRRDLDAVKKVIRYITGQDKKISSEALDHFNNNVRTKYGHNITDEHLATFRNSVANRNEVEAYGECIAWARKQMRSPDISLAQKKDACAVMIASTLLREHSRTTDLKGRKLPTHDLRVKARLLANSVKRAPEFNRLMQGKTAEDLKSIDYMDITRKYRGESFVTYLESKNVQAPAEQDEAARVNYLIDKLAIEKCKEKFRADPGNKWKKAAEIDAMVNKEKALMDAKERGLIARLMTLDNVMENAANDPKKLLEDYRKLAVAEKVNSFMDPEDMPDADKLASKIAAVRIGKMLRNDPSMFESAEAAEKMLENTKRRIRGGEAFNYMLRNNDLHQLLSGNIEDADAKHRQSELIVNTAEEIVSRSFRTMSKTDLPDQQRQEALCSVIAGMEVINGSAVRLGLQNGNGDNNIVNDVENAVRTSISKRASELKGSKDIEDLKEKYQNSFYHIAKEDRKQIFEEYSDIRQKNLRAGVGMKK